MQINNFSMGINTKKNPLISIAPLVSKNIDSTSEVLRPIKKYKVISNNTYKDYIFIKDDIKIQSDSFINAIAKKDFIYFTNDDGASKYKIDDDSINPLGIKQPKSNALVTVIANTIQNVNSGNAPTVSLSVSIVLLKPPTSASITSESNDDGLPADTYKYILVNVFGDSNSKLYNISKKITEKSTISISDIKGIQDKVKVYRLYNQAYYYIGEATSSDNTIKDDTLDISDNDVFIDNVDFKNNITYKHRSVYKKDGDYGYKEVHTTTPGEGRVGGFKLSHSSDDDDADYVGSYRSYNRRFHKLDSDNDDKHNIVNNDLIETITQLTGKYKYKYTYYNSIEGIESVGSPDTIEVDCNNEAIKLTNIIAASDNQVDKIRIYRLGGSLTKYHLVDEIDSSSTEYIDSFQDTYLLDDLYKSYSHYAPPKIKNLIYTAGYYVGYSDTKVYYSNTGEPNYWDTYNYIDFEDTVMGIGVISTGVLIFLQNKTYLIQGNSSNNMYKLLLSSSQGCIDYKSIQYIDNNIIWVSNDGLCSTDGNSIMVISKQYIQDLNIGRIKSSAVKDSIYYILGENNSYAIDFTNNSMRIFTLELDIKSLHYDAYTDKLYVITNDNKLGILGDGDDAEFEYFSSYIALGSGTNVKIYNELYLLLKGNITIDVYIDGKLINSKNYDTNELTQKTKLVLQSRHRGNYLQFKLSGTGEVYELELKAIGRQNGK